MNISSASKKKSIAMIMAVIVQLALLGLTVWVVVLVPRSEKDPAFIAQKTIYLPQSELDHQAALSEFQQVASAPMAMDMLTVEAMLPDVLPALPVLPTETFSEFDFEHSMADAQSLLGDVGALGEIAGIGGTASKMSFLGIETEASRVVIAFDVSTSVINNMKKAGLSLKQIKAETEQLIDGLNANTLFGVIQFIRAYEQLETYLQPATVGNKMAALTWLDQRFGNTRSSRNWVRGNPDGIESVLEICFALQPDVLFILSDGSFQSTLPDRGSRTVDWDAITVLIKQLQKNLVDEPKVHFISFGAKPNDGAAMEKAARVFGGVYKAF